jgi:hypothetical protein
MGTFAEGGLYGILLFIFIWVIYVFSEKLIIGSIYICIYVCVGIMVVTYFKVIYIGLVYHK